MISYNNEMLEKYLLNDWILDLIQKNMSIEEASIRTNKWLLEMDNKRMIYADVYGDVLKAENNGTQTKKSVLDVGGGVSTLTKILAKNSKYTLCDFLAHGGKDYIQNHMEEYKLNWLNSDWYYTDFDSYDIIIANDIFPDVDQRLELFIDRMLPICRELRLVLTYYNEPRFYQMGRSDDSEILTFLSWDGEILGMKLKRYLSRINADITDLEFMSNNKESIYWNLRQVCYLTIKGGII